MTLSAHRISIEYHRENIHSMIYQKENLEIDKVKALIGGLVPDSYL